MPNTPIQSLISRLEAIRVSLSKRESALALIGLGSAGRDLQRLDEYSDLDFFVIVVDGAKQAYLQDLSWLSEIAHIAYHFRNTADGYKLLFADGIFCEFAVFEQEELNEIPFTAGRVIWKREHIPETIAVPIKASPSESKPTAEWLLNEALTNLYVGLCRDWRGEKLSGARFIQGYTIDRLLELVETGELAKPINGNDAVPIDPDLFAPERRFEQRYPGTATVLPDFMQGYARNRQSAAAILEYLDTHFEINQAMQEAILDLCQPSEARPA